MKIKVTEQDLLDIMTCGRTYMGEWKNLFYSLKDVILNQYGMFYGYCEQTWYDYDFWNYDEEDEPEIFAEHCHILKVFYLSTMDGKYTSIQLHSPTNEFSYWNEWNVTKQSPNYKTLKKKCLPELSFKGTKSRKGLREDREVAFKSLKRLTKKYGWLLYK